MENVCQCCGMPMGETEELLGTEKDGTRNTDYCKYCYENGAFTYHGDMDGMIDICVQPMLDENPGMTEKAARDMMRGFLPTLKRWKTA